MYLNLHLVVISQSPIEVPNNPTKSVYPTTPWDMKASESKF